MKEWAVITYDDFYPTVDIFTNYDEAINLYNEKKEKYCINIMLVRLLEKREINEEEDN